LFPTSLTLDHGQKIHNGQIMRILIGTYTRGTASDGIYRLTLDLRSGGLSEPVLVARSDNPSWLISQGDRIVAANEFADGEAGGELSVYSANDDTLALTQRVPSHGADPCHLACSGERLAVANYSGSTVALYEWRRGAVGDLIRRIEHSSTGSHPRQATAHPHGVYFTGGELLVPDLGADRIYRYDPDDGTLCSEQSVSPGAGPRHLTRDGAFLVNELDNTVQSVNDDGPAVSTLPPAWRGESSTAEIVRHKERMLYVSNRGHDSIAVFAVGSELRAVQHASTHGRHPRHFLIDPDGRWLLVANRDTDNIVCLPILANGLLGDPVAETTCPAPVCLRYWDADRTTG
jgi:6-phosphogluconolactonase